MCLMMMMVVWCGFKLGRRNVRTSARVSRDLSSHADLNAGGSTRRSLSEEECSVFRESRIKRRWWRTHTELAWRFQQIVNTSWRVDAAFSHAKQQHPVPRINNIQKPTVNIYFSIYIYIYICMYRWPVRRLFLFCIWQLPRWILNRK